MSHETEPRIDLSRGDRTASRLRVSDEGSDVQLSRNGTLATRLDALVGNSDRKDPKNEFDWRYWSRRDSDLKNTQSFAQHEIDRKTVFGVRVVIDRLERLLVLEISRRSGHWTYAWSREQNYRIMLATERKLLARLESEVSR